MEDPYDPAAWPRWILVASTALMVLLSAVLVATADRPKLVAPLALVLVGPWLVHLLGRHLPAPAFLVLAYVPLLVLSTVARDAAGDGAVLTACMVLFVQGESVAAYRPRSAAVSVVLGALTLLLYTGSSRDSVISTSSDTLLWFGGSATAVAVGYLLRRQHHTLVELRAAQAQLVGEAALRERQRVARDVHDVVAHSLTVTLMHVTAARMAVRRNSAAAVEALEEAEALGRRSLDEIRRTVAVLRQGEERPTDPALPGAGDLHELIEGYRAAGLEVGLDVAGDLSGLDPSTSLTVYRVVQEAVANAITHAPGTPVSVDIVMQDDRLRVTVRNPVPAVAVVRHPTAGGLGLVGMQERVDLVGGRLSVGSRDGQWVVDVTVAQSDQGRWCR